MKEKEELTNKIVYYGLWQSKEVVWRKLLEISTKVKKEVALKCQLKFIQVVLMQSSKVMNIFKLSQEKKKFNIEQLQSNLETLIEEAYSINRVPAAS